MIFLIHVIGTSYLLQITFLYCVFFLFTFSPLQPCDQYAFTLFITTISEGMQYLTDKDLYEILDSKYYFTTFILNSVLYFAIKKLTSFSQFFGLTFGGQFIRYHHFYLSDYISNINTNLMICNFKNILYQQIKRLTPLEFLQFVL